MKKKMTEWGNFGIILIVCQKMPSRHNLQITELLTGMSDELKTNKKRAKKKIKAKKRKGRTKKIKRNTIKKRQRIRTRKKK